MTPYGLVYGSPPGSHHEQVLHHSGYDSSDAGNSPDDTLDTTFVHRTGSAGRAQQVGRNMRVEEYEDCAHNPSDEEQHWCIRQVDGADDEDDDDDEDVPPLVHIQPSTHGLVSSKVHAASAPGIKQQLPATANLAYPHHSVNVRPIQPVQCVVPAKPATQQPAARTARGQDADRIIAHPTKLQTTRNGDAPKSTDDDCGKHTVRIPVQQAPSTRPSQKSSSATPAAAAAVAAGNATARTRKAAQSMTRSEAARIIQRWWRGWRLWGQQPVLQQLVAQHKALEVAYTKFYKYLAASDGGWRCLEHTSACCRFLCDRQTGLETYQTYMFLARIETRLVGDGVVCIQGTNDLQGQDAQFAFFCFSVCSVEDNLA